MTDNEIVRYISESYMGQLTVGRECIALINRQKAEIEWLQKYHDDMEGAIYSFREDHAKVKFFKQEIKAEAIKEFAERLKDEWLAVVLLKNKSDDYAEGYHDALCYVEDQIDNLAKEMVGESNG